MNSYNTKSEPESPTRLTKADINRLMENEKKKKIRRSGEVQVHERGELYETLKKQIEEGNKFEILRPNPTFLECCRIEEEVRAQNLKTAEDIEACIIAILNDRDELYTGKDDYQKKVKYNFMLLVLTRKLIKYTV